MQKKYKLLADQRFIKPDDNRILYKIQALINFGYVHAGDIGGYVENERNLSQEGMCWISDNAMVYGDAHVRDNAIIHNNAVVCDNAYIVGNTDIGDNAFVCDNAFIRQDAHIHDNASIQGDAQVYDNAYVMGNAIIYENATIANNSVISGYAEICGHAMIRDNAHIHDNSIVKGHAVVCDHVRIYENTIISGYSKIDGYVILRGNSVVKTVRDYIVFRDWWFEGQHITYTFNNDKYIIRETGFYGSGKQLIDEAHHTSETAEREYKRIIRYVNSIRRERGLKVESIRRNKK